MPSQPMDKLNESIVKTTEKLEQLKRQKRAREQRENEKLRAIETRRKIIAGSIFLDAFPEFEELMPQKSNEQNDIEFLPLKNFLTALASDKELVNRLKKSPPEQ
jgi:hypothetical protein